MTLALTLTFWHHLNIQTQGRQSSSKIERRRRKGLERKIWFRRKFSRSGNKINSV